MTRPLVPDGFTEPVTLEGSMAAAYRAGHAAGQAGDRVTTNPHDPRSADPVQRVLAKMWVRGHSEGNPMPDPDDVPED